MEEAPKCFGKFTATNSGSAGCVKCPFRASCEYYEASEVGLSGRLNMISFEHVEEWSEELADFDHIPGCTEDETSFAVSSADQPDVPGLAQFLRFMLELDDYALAILAEIIVPQPGELDRYSISDLAKIHGCSRQAMHRKILRTARHNPLLGSLLQLTFRKLRRSRSKFHEALNASGKR